MKLGLVVAFVNLGVCSCLWLSRERCYRTHMPTYQRVGLHVSAAGGAENAPENAQEMGAEVFQFFSRSPRGGGAPEISDEQAKLFRARSREYGLESYIHTPYYVNFASRISGFIMVRLRWCERSWSGDRNWA